MIGQTVTLTCAAVLLAAVLFGIYLLKRGAAFGKKRAYMLIIVSAVFFGSLFVGADNLFRYGLYFRYDLFISGGDTSGREYQADINSPAENIVVNYRGLYTLELKVTNRGSLTWDSSLAENPIYLSWHILSSQGSMIRFENPRISFPKPVAAGESQLVPIVIMPTDYDLPAGQYIFEFDLIHADVAWFGDKGSRTLRVPVEVTR